MPLNFSMKKPYLKNIDCSHPKSLSVIRISGLIVSRYIPWIYFTKFMLMYYFYIRRKIINNCAMTDLKFHWLADGVEKVYVLSLGPVVSEPVLADFVNSVKLSTRTNISFAN